ncbi:hypothetical protein CRG98_049468, partial [Punica granatum]
RIEAIEIVDDPNPKEGVDDPNWRVMAAIEAPTFGIGRTLKLEIFSILKGGATTLAITLSIGVVGALYDIDFVQISEKFDIVL